MRCSEEVGFGDPGLLLVAIPASVHAAKDSLLDRSTGDFKGAGIARASALN